MKHHQMFSVDGDQDTTVDITVTDTGVSFRTRATAEPGSYIAFVDTRHATTLPLDVARDLLEHILAVIPAEEAKNV